jgi:hypothetical protein
VVTVNEVKIKFHHQVREIYVIGYQIHPAVFPVIVKASGKRYTETTKMAR